MTASNLKLQISDRPYPGPRPSVLNPRFSVLLVFATALLAGLAYLCSPLFPVRSAFSEEERIAVHLARGDGFLSPFADGSNAPPTSWCPPVYPFLVSLIYRMLGVRTHASILTILIFNQLCRAAAVAAVFQLGRKMDGLRVGLIAAAILMIDPVLMRSATFCWDNCLSLAIFLGLFASQVFISPPLVLRGRVREGAPMQSRSGPHPSPPPEYQGRGKARNIAVGLGLGILILTNAAYLFAAPAICLMNRKSRTVVFMAFLLTLLPWTLRNYACFGRFIPIRGNLYTELWLGNAPGSTGWMTMQTLQEHPSDDLVERNLVLSLGETKYFDLCRQRFWEEFNADPEAFFARSLRRIAYLFVGEPSRPDLLFNCVLTALGLAGACLTVSRSSFFGVAMLAVTPYVFTEVYDRYMLPLHAASAILAAIAIYQFCCFVRKPMTAE